MGAEDMAQQLGALAAFPEDQGSIPRTPKIKSKRHPLMCFRHFECMFMWQKKPLFKKTEKKNFSEKELHQLEWENTELFKTSLFLCIHCSQK